MTADAAQTMKCPKCQGTAFLTVPARAVAQSRAVYACPACGNVVKADGKVFVDTAEKLCDVFRGATEGQKVIDEALKGEKLPPAARALLQAQVLEYGVQMWFDGLKQGLLMNTVRAEYEHGKDIDRHRQPEARPS